MFVLFNSLLFKANLLVIGRSRFLAADKPVDDVLCGLTNVAIPGRVGKSGRFEFTGLKYALLSIIDFCCS